VSIAACSIFVVMTCLPFSRRAWQTPAQNPVVGFRSAGREINFARLRADERGDFVARLVNGFLGVPAHSVLTVGVAVIFQKIRRHFFQYALVEFSRRSVIEVKSLSF